MKLSSFSIFTALFLCVACGRSPRFEVSGEIAGADPDQYVVLEKSDFHGRWMPVDSTKVGGNGKFSIHADAPASPDIYRLSLDGKFVYLPIDSIESLHLVTSAAEFGRVFTLDGTDQAKRLAEFEKELIALSDPDSTALAQFKRNVYTKYIKDGQGSILSYYVLTKIVNGAPLYDPADGEDAKYYAAVATQFQNYRPNDPHGKMVKEVSLAAMRQRNSALGRKTVVQANELKVIDIALPGVDGKMVRLSDVVGKGKKVVLIFSMMTDPNAPAFNRQLARIYEAKRGAVEFFQVSFDEAQFEWREAARNLPWINVIDPGNATSNALVEYNVSSLPAVFIYSAEGELVERPESLDDLQRKL